MSIIVKVSDEHIIGLIRQLGEEFSVQAEGRSGKPKDDKVKGDENADENGEPLLHAFSPSAPRRERLWVWALTDKGRFLLARHFRWLLSGNGGDEKPAKMPTKSPKIHLDAHALHGHNESATRC
jgi:hypothetical protein